MIDQARLDRIRLHPRPLFYRVFGRTFLAGDYRKPRARTRILVEGAERLPAEGGILVMNHTDRFGSWPLQFWLMQERDRYTSIWVKGKYYENPAMAWFFDQVNAIPIPSRGYVLTKDFQRVMGRVPSDVEYAALKAIIDAGGAEATARAAGGGGVTAFLDAFWPQSPSGRWPGSFERRFGDMMKRVVALNEEAIAQRLFLLVFPQGTRSRRLTPGHHGVAQIALHTKATIIPVGANGSDRLYPKNSPLSKGGTVVYRIGEPLTFPGALERYAIDEPYVPFTREADRHEAKFRALTDEIMRRIDGLLDPEYRFGDDDEREQGARRFV